VWHFRSARSKGQGGIADVDTGLGVFVSDFYEFFFDIFLFLLSLLGFNVFEHEVGGDRIREAYHPNSVFEHLK
jgi:hypothetical protein